jgi:hypothetical protein
VHSFIELYNPTAGPVNLSGWRISYADTRVQDGRTGYTWEANLAGTMQSRHSYLIRGQVLTDLQAGALMLNQFDLDRPDNWLDNRAYTVKLIDPDEQAVDVMDVTVPNKHTACRRVDLAENSHVQIDYRAERGMTPGRLDHIRPRSVGDGAWDFTPEPDNPLAFSAEAGLYQAEFMLELETGYAPSFAEIWFTTDGSDPERNAPNATEYTLPIEIKDRTADAHALAGINASGGVYTAHFAPPNGPIYKGNVIRARVFTTDGKALTDVVTKSYFIDADYGDLAVISLVTDKDHLFGRSDGIYTNFYERGREWERPVHFELFDPKHGSGGAVSLNMGVRINGAYTRNSPQKSLRLYARSEYDQQNVINYDLFEGRAITSAGDNLTQFKRFLLRNAGTDAFGAVMRCALAQDLLRDTAVPFQAYRQSVLFINGEFWGIYYIRERIDEESIARKYGFDSADDVELLRVGWIGRDSLYMDEEMAMYDEMWEWFNSLRDEMTDEQYQQAQRYIDMDNFIDYYIFNIFVGNTDWPAAHHTLWRYAPAGFPGDASDSNSATDGRWRWHAHDLDYSLAPRSGDPNLDRTVLFNPYEYLWRSTNTGEAGFSHYENKHDRWSTVYWRRLVTNREFVEKFLDRYHHLMSTGFSAEAMNARIDTMAAGIAPVVAEHWNRWPHLASLQSHWRPAGMSHEDAWREEVDRLRDFADRRHDILNEYTKNFFEALGHG